MDSRRKRCGPPPANCIQKVDEYLQKSFFSESQQAIGGDKEHLTHVSVELQPVGAMKNGSAILLYNQERERQDRVDLHLVRVLFLASFMFFNRSIKPITDILFHLDKPSWLSSES